MGILSGLRVIDAATYIAGPCAATVLADFGAEVIKIERPPHGDPYRYLSQLPPMPAAEDLYCWILDNRNKRSLALNLADEAGREVFLRLAATADVCILNFLPPLVARFRLSYEELRAVNPRLIYAHVTGYGELGVDADQPGYDFTAYWARSGLMDTMYAAGSEPCRSPAGFGDHPTGMSLAAAILLALYHRERTGQGSKVSTSLAANGAWSNGCLIQAALCGATPYERQGHRRTINALVNHYQARDGQRFLLCLIDTQKDWPKLCRALGRPDLVEEERFRTPQLRWANAGLLVDLLDAEFAGKDLAEWIRLFREHDVLWGRAPATEQVAGDPQMLANGVFPRIADSPDRELRTVTSPVWMEGVEKESPRWAPAAGQHTREILQSLGYDEEAVAQLLARGAAMAG